MHQFFKIIFLGKLLHKIYENISLDQKKACTSWIFTADNFFFSIHIEIAYLESKKLALGWNEKKAQIAHSY